MNQTLKLAALGATLAVFTAGCATYTGQTNDPNDPNRTQRGALIGAAIGAAAGLLSGDDAVERRQRAMVGAGEPGVQVFPRSLITSGRSWRNESVYPAFTTADDVGQATFLPKCKPAFAAACVQSRCDGSLKSPVRNTGKPVALAGFIVLTSAVVSAPRVAVAWEIAWASVVILPSRMSYG